MRLRKPCEHDEHYESHWTYDCPHENRHVGLQELHGCQEENRRFCPGGEFLPEDALVVERIDGEWQLPHRALLVLSAGNAFSHPEGPIALLNDFADAFKTDQVGEPG